VYSITSNDANFIDIGDNFGFDGSISWQTQIATLLM
jgi:hypothetical protein